MTREGDALEDRHGVSRVRVVLLPLAVLVVAVAIVGGLVLSGVVQGHEPRRAPEQPSTTRLTVEIAP